MSWLKKALNASVRNDAGGIEPRANSADSAKSTPNGTNDTIGTRQQIDAVIYALPFCPASIDERAAIAQHEGGVPQHYAFRFAELQHECPADIALARWHLAINDAGRFLDQWGRNAHALGWLGSDLFGRAQPTATALATMGLVWRLNGRRVLALTAAGAHLSDNNFIRKDQLT